MVFHFPASQENAWLPRSSWLLGLLAAEPIGPGGPRPPTFLGDVNFFFLYIAIITGENLQ